MFCVGEAQVFPEGLAQIISVSVLLPLGALVLAKNPRSQLYRLFFMMTLSNCVIYGGAIVRIAADGYDAARLATLFLQIGIFSAPFLTYHFVVRFLGIARRFKPAVIVGYILLPLFLSAAVIDYLGDSNWIMAISYAGGHYEPSSLNIVGILFAPIHFGYLLLGLWHTVRAYVTAKDILRIQIKYFLLGFFVAAGGAALGIILRDNALSAATSLFFYVSIAYAITRYQFMDVQVAVRLGTIYLAVSIVLLSIYAAAIFSLANGFGSMAPLYSPLFPILGIVLIALIFNPIRNFVQRIVDKSFFRERLHAENIFAQFNTEASVLLQVTDLANLAIKSVDTAVRASSITFLLRERDEGKQAVWIAVGAMGIEREGLDRFRQGSSFLGNVKEFPILRSRLEFEANNGILPESDYPLLGAMNAWNLSLLIPVYFNGCVEGVLALGEKRSQEQYTLSEVGFLSAMAAQVATVLQKIRLFGKVEQMEKDRHRTNTLAALGTFASEIAHEIKNPLVPLKTYAQLLPQRLNDAQFQKRLIEVLPREIERIEEVVKQMLKGRMADANGHTPVDLMELSRSSLALFEYDLLKHNVKSRIEEEGKIPAIDGDEKQLRQVFHNLILNAIEAMPSGGDLNIRASTENGFVRLSFVDTGCGMTDEVKKNLFRSFHTTKAYGTGIGLAICKKIVGNHHGAIRVESAPGKGSSFIIEFTREH